MTVSARPARHRSIVHDLTTWLLRPPLTVYGWLRSSVARTGLFDSCETAGFTVRESGGDAGCFSVTSGADPRFKLTELADLAGSLRAAGYLIELRPGDDEPFVLVRAPMD